MIRPLVTFALVSSAVAEPIDFSKQIRPILSACGLRYVGENVAAGYPTARAVMTGWMNSPGHRANILKREFNRLGVGVAYSKSGRPYYCQVFGQV